MTEAQYKALERRIDDVALRCARVEALLRMVSPDLWQVALELDSLGYLSTQSNTATATARPMVAKLGSCSTVTIRGCSGSADRTVRVVP